MARKTLSLKTKLASALLELMIQHERAGRSPGLQGWYQDAKNMTEDQLISLFQWDHGMLHESGHPQRDMYWNITPRLIKAHRDKTKRDAAIIAKGRRIRGKLLHATKEDVIRAWNNLPAKLRGKTATVVVVDDPAFRPKRRLRSRGFDRTRRRRMDGTVEKR